MPAFIAIHLDYFIGFSRAPKYLDLLWKESAYITSHSKCKKFRVFSEMEILHLNTASSSNNNVA